MLPPLRILLILTLVILPHAGRCEAIATPAVNCQKPVIQVQSFIMTCAYNHQSGPLTLVVHGAIDDPKSGNGLPTSIEILSDGKHAQTLALQPEDSDALPLENLVGSLDLNFDGFDDLQILSGRGAGPNSSYAYWLYVPARHLFEHRPDIDDDLSGFDVSADPKAKIIVTSGRSSCCQWDTQTFHWVNDRLLLQETSSRGGLMLDDVLGDVKSVQAFAAQAGGICATHTLFYDDNNGITQETIETQGDPCDEAQDYRKKAKIDNKTLNGLQKNGNVTDFYRNGVLLQRTLVYNPPKPAENTD
jgi:hypothetical protein